MLPAFAAAFTIGAGLLNMEASRREGEANAKSAELSAQEDLWAARLTREKAVDDERYLRVMARKELGSISANYSASGIAMTGSALSVLEESAANAESDALNIRKQGEYQARAYERSAAAKRALGKNYQKAGEINSAAAALNMGADLASINWSKGSKSSSKSSSSSRGVGTSFSWLGSSVTQ